MSKSEVVISDINRNKPKFIGQEELVSLIKGADSIESYHPHLHAFYSECSESLITKFAEENNLTAEELVNGYEKGVKPYLPTTDKKEAFFDNLREMQEESSMDPDDAMDLAREAQEWARNN